MIESSEFTGTPEGDALIRVSISNCTTTHGPWYLLVFHFKVRGYFSVKVLAPAATLALILLCHTTLLHGQTDVEAKAAAASQSLVKKHVAWETKLTSPGASISAKEVGRQGSSVQYYLYVSGLPPDKLYTVMTWPVGEPNPSTMMEGASLGKDGIVICAGRTPQQCGDPSTKDDPIGFAFNPAKGEPCRLALVAQNDRAAIVIVPDPIVARNKGCTLSAERLLPRFELAYFTGSGFPANTEVSFDGESYGEKHSVKTKTDSEGKLQFAIMPAVTGHDKGTTVVKTAGVNCSLSVKFDWGN